MRPLVPESDSTKTFCMTLVRPKVSMKESMADMLKFPASTKRLAPVELKTVAAPWAPSSSRS